MRPLLILLLAFTALPALAQQPTPPSDESLRQLFEATYVTRILDTYMSTIDSGMQAGVRAALQGTTPNAQQQQIISDLRAQLVREFRATLSWGKLEPVYMDIYRRNFTPQQVDDMLAF